jgi:hypothetical protein
MRKLGHRLLEAAPTAPRLGAGWQFVLAVWLVSRVFFLVTGALGHEYLTPAMPGGSPREPGGILGYWATWDGGWYSAIAKQGYFSPPSTSFFPLYPIVLWLGTLIAGGPAVWGVTISVAALLPTLYFLYRLAEDLFDESTARAATLALAFFPSAFFLNAVYTESLFLMLTTGTVWALRIRRDLLLAAVFAYFAMATRNVGVFLFIPLAWHWFRRRRELGLAGALALVISPAGLVAFMFYLQRVLGDPLYFAVAQRETWGRTLTDPIKTLHKAWTTGVFGARYAFHPHAIFGNVGAEPAFKASDTFNLILFGLLVILVVVGAFRLPFDLWLYSVLVMLVPLLTPSGFWALTSFNRYMLAPFPLFIVLGRILRRSPFLLIPWLEASAALGVYLTLLFTTWRWVA